MRPELPYVAATGVAVVGATMRDGHIPPLSRAVVGLVALILVASATTGTKIAPLVHAFGLLVLLVTVMAAVNITLKKAKPTS